MGTRTTTKLLVPPKASAERRKRAAAVIPASVQPRKAVSLTKTARKSDAEQPYHHGDLHEALLQAAGRVAVREGLNGLTLRAVAREAGVSHAAPAHHFGDMTGLLSELAAIGFKEFSASLDAAAKSAPSEDQAAERRASAYVAFARDNPCMFQLMFRAERLDHDRPALQQSSDHAFTKLAGIVAAQRHEDVSTDHLTLSQAADIARIWSMVHGFAMLHLDGRIKHILDASPPGTTEEMLLAAMLKPDPRGR
jgi:AcrR family transcriptional regulator